MRAICLYRDESITAQRDIGVVAVSDIRLLPGPKFKMRLSHTFFGSSRIFGAFVKTGRLKC